MATNTDNLDITYVFQYYNSDLYEDIYYFFYTGSWPKLVLKGRFALKAYTNFSPRFIRIPTMMHLLFAKLTGPVFVDELGNITNL